MLPRGATMVTSPSNSVHTLGRGVGRNPDLVCGIHACGYTHLARLLRQIVGFDANHPRLGFWWSTALVFLAFRAAARRFIDRFVRSACGLPMPCSELTRWRN